MAPCSNKRREAENISHRHGAARVPLKTVVQPNELRGCCCIFLRQTFNCGFGDSGDLAYARRRVVEKASAKFLDAECEAVDVVLIMQAITENDVHHSERERAVRAGHNRNVLVGLFRSSRAEWVDGDDLRAS